MQIPKWLHGILTESDADRVAKAVGEAETKTSGEIVPVIVHRSSTVGHIPLAVTLLLTSLVLALEVSIGSDWHFSGVLYWPIVLLVVFALAGFLSQVDFIERWFTPRDDQEQQVFQRAQIEFYHARLTHTQASTGILLFISMAEHRAVVLADQGIAEKLPPETWQGVVDTMISGIKKKQLAEGMVEAIKQCGNILEKEFPALSENKNELPNTLIIKES